MAVLAAHDHRAARPANGVGTKTFLKHHAVLGQLVDFRRGIHRLQPAVVRANGVRSVVVTEHKQNVRALVLGGQIQRQQQGESKKDFFHESMRAAQISSQRSIV